MIREFLPNDSLRIKIENLCNLRCKFCHSEGNCNADRMSLFNISDIIDFALKYKFLRIHITGGEPTLHPELGKIINLIKSNGLFCSVTSNGQCDNEIISDAKKSKINSFNFSLHTINPVMWGNLQKEFDYLKSVQQIQKTINAINYSAKIGILTKVNIVVGDNPFSAIEIIDQFNNRGIEIRLLDMLGNNLAINNIQKILNHYKAYLAKEVTTIGSSQVKYCYNSSIGSIVVKGIKKNYVSSVCEGCTEKCFESVYGMRIEAVNDNLFARFCIHRDNSRTVQRFDTMAKSRQFHEIFNLNAK